MKFQENCLVPLRQLTFRHLMPSSIACAVTDFASGIWFCFGWPRPRPGRSWRHGGGSPSACRGFPRPNQSRNIGRAHPPSRLVPERPDKRLQPLLKSFGQSSAITSLHQLAPHQSPIDGRGNPKSYKSAKVVLACDPSVMGSIAGGPHCTYCQPSAANPLTPIFRQVALLAETGGP